MKFLLELASEEIPARMQAAAAEQLRSRFIEGLKAAGLPHGDVIADATPRRLWLIAEDVAAASAAASEERKGPAANAPDAAIAGFLRGVGLARDALEERQTPKGVVLFAHILREGRSAETILAELVPAIVSDFQWPKSMRWGSGTARWVRPLTGIVALLDGEIVPCAAHGINAGRTTRGHRILGGEVAIENAENYAAQMRASFVIVASAERRAAIEAAAATAAGALTVIPDPGLVAENAGLTEWPVPMLGSFDPAFLAVPREIIQLTMRTNQKYFACADASGALAPNFVCVANLQGSDGGKAIIAGNERVLSARLADAKFFWDQDVKAGLESFVPKLADIVFHEKLGTVADKVERVARLARWLVESGAVGAETRASNLADLAERAARLCKADLVSATVGEFPEVQGIAGAYLARLADEDPQVADAIRDHYKPVGQGDNVPTAPVSVAVALADKLDTLVGFFFVSERPTGSRDPYALRRAVLGCVQIICHLEIRLSLYVVFRQAQIFIVENLTRGPDKIFVAPENAEDWTSEFLVDTDAEFGVGTQEKVKIAYLSVDKIDFSLPGLVQLASPVETRAELVSFTIDRLKVQQRETGVRHDLIDAVFALGGEDDLVRLLARVRALQSFITTDDGANLHAGYKRAASILRIEAANGITPSVARDRHGSEAALAAALNKVLPAAAAAVDVEDFSAAMTALAALRAPVDAFFADVMVNDPDPVIRADRLGLLTRFRDAVHSVADFSKIEG